MALTTEEKRAAAVDLALQMFPGVTVADLDVDDLVAAINSIDVAMDTVISTIPGAWQTKTMKQAIKDNIPDPFKTNSTAAQKALALALWAMKEGGVI